MNKIAEYKRDPRGDFSSRSETGQSQNETRLQQDCYCYCRKCTIECPTRIKVFASEELFSRSNMEWKNCAVCVEIIQINIDKKHSSINANEDQITSGYCCGCRSNSTNPETENCLSPTKVMTCTNRQLANDCCVQSKSAPNDLSKFMITAQEESNFPVVSMPTMAYQDLVVQTNDGNRSSDMQRPPCRFKSYEHSSPLPLTTCNNLQFNGVWSKPIHKIAVWSDLYEQFKTRTLARFRHMSENSTSHLRFWTMKRSREITALYYLILLLLIFTSVTNASFAGRRYSTLRNLGLRFPRQSGFRHNIQKPRNQRCEAITVPICRDIGYNQTDMSLSITNKFTQHEAEQELAPYTPLINWNCSAELKLFLCSIYTPICMEHYGHFLPPCRFICERAKKGCLPIIHHYSSYKWPEKLRCEQFPTYAGKHPMCMHFNLTRTKEEEAKIFNSEKLTEEDVNSPKSTSETKTRLTTRRPPKSTKAAKTRGTTP
uniref:uncharacterized protein LOC120330047 isoform X1 n=1 Tax=Styela clava TaxID=7725 RepID=UPI00193A3A26|nr:uncharacterized protein LOC120330047 isoform X1 [Styela clava]